MNTKTGKHLMFMCHLRPLETQYRTTETYVREHFIVEIY